MGEINVQEDNFVNKQLGKYKIVKLLGRGGMGAVYKAHHTMLDKVVCLKILFPSGIKADERIIERFFGEAKAVAKLDHPNIVRIYDIEKEQDIYFIVMEYIDGKTLAQLMEERDAFRVRETIHIVLEVAKALAAAHTKGIIHRDVKPENIMINKGGEIKLTDFGLAIPIDMMRRISGSNEIWGTPFYLAPECINCEFVDNRTDIYALGILLFHMLAGEPPYTGRNPVAILRQHLETPIPSLRKFRSDVPVELERISKKAMAKNAQDRFAHVQEMINALQECANELAREQREETTRCYNKEDLPELQEKAPVAPTGQKIRVMVVDDSPTMCKMLCRHINNQSDMQVAGIAQNGEEALRLIPQHDPQVITLDYNMEVMDGRNTLKHIMAKYPRPVIMLSAFTYEGAWTSFECLSYGAIDFLWKASQSTREEFHKDVLHKIRNAARLQLVSPNKPRIIKTYSASARLSTASAQWLTVIGGGEGGYHAAFKIIPHVPKNIPCAIVMVQQMPDELISTFASYLNQYSKMTVKKVDDGEPLREGVCYVTNHAHGLAFLPSTGNGVTVANEKQVADAGRAFRDTLSSALRIYGHHTTAVVLSGEIPDAVPALQQLRRVGGQIVVQQPTTCLNAVTALAAIKEKNMDKIVVDIDIPSVLWHLLKIAKEKELAMPQVPQSAPR